ncbi:drug/metabolite transporter (DMT)-like permease [Aliiruegeria haliotis]|uniref:Drug/metabolite transporter (DMT)-like permease n=1 Tax=Aliiruegeria haliotis TaxID=1280846 RepID=A0A2T0RIC6_9RHOB|nr:DMT family transporter [Aliiruegeria haliotis]PRY20872.1 drug/metabolite transporter (DMT)-like permease [Aliiruegeria haliotis]
MHANTKAAFFGLLAFGLFSTHDVVVKYLGGTYSTFQIVFFSVLLGFPLATLMLMHDNTDANLRPRHPGWTATRTFAVMVTGACGFYAVTTLPLAQFYAIIFAMPLVITLLSIPLLGEKVGIHRAIAVLAGLIGVLIVLRPGAAELTLGHAAALIAAFSGALASVIVRKVGHAERSVVFLLYPMVANVIVMGAILPFVYIPPSGIDFAAQAAVAVLAFCATLGVIAAYKTGEAVIVAPMQYSQILWATFYGMIFFGERPDLPTIVGAGVIISSGIYILMRESRTSSVSNRPVLRTRTRHETGTFLRAGSFLRRNGEPAKKLDNPTKG